VGNGRLAAIQDAIVREIKKQYPRIKHCTPHDGAFTFQELKRFRVRAPASVKVAWLGSDVDRDKMERDVGVASFGIYVVCRDRPHRRATREAMNWAEAIGKWIDGKNFGYDWLNPIRRRSIENPYSTDQDRSGTATVVVKVSAQIGVHDDGTDGEDTGTGAVKTRHITLMRRSMARTRPGSMEQDHDLTIYHAADAVVKTSSGLKEWGRVSVDRKSPTHEFVIPWVAGLHISTGEYVGIGGGDDENVYRITDVENENEANTTFIIRAIYLGRKDRLTNQ